MARCSRVWGMMPSSAAITSITMSMPPTPASMFLMSPSWPGTSTMPSRLPFGKVEGREPEVEGDAALFFLLETVRVSAGEGLDEARFPVVDMSGSAEDDVFHEMDKIQIASRSHRIQE